MLHTFHSSNGFSLTPTLPPNHLLIATSRLFWSISSFQPKKKTIMTSALFLKPTLEKVGPRTHFLAILFVKSTFWKCCFELHSQNVTCIFKIKDFVNHNIFFFLIKHKIWILHFKKRFLPF